MRHDDRAQVGTTALISFIIVIVAATWVVATIMTPLTSLGAKSGAQGREAAKDSGTALRLLAVYGLRNTTASGIWDLAAVVEAPPGSDFLDLTTANVTWRDGNGERLYDHAPDALANGAASSTHFNVTWLRGFGGDFVMRGGEQVLFHVNLAGAEVPERATGELRIRPPFGAVADATITTPATFGDDLFVALR